jgi:hypothetical protein
MELYLRTLLRFYGLDKNSYALTLLTVFLLTRCMPFFVFRY